MQSYDVPQCFGGEIQYLSYHSLIMELVNLV